MRCVFRIRREERWLALAATVVLVGLHALMWAYFPATFYQKGELGFWSIFYNHMHLSGFDNYSYIFVSSTKIYYEMLRHPLFAAWLLPLYGLNELLRPLTDHNCAVFLVSALTILCSVYALVFLYRVLRERVGLGRWDAHWLTVLFSSFAMVMLTMLVPDHFCISLMLLLLTLWLSTSPRRQPLWVASVLATLVGGTSLSNIAKSWLASLFARRGRFFRPASLLAIVVVPLLLFLGAGYGQQKILIEPQQAWGQRQLEKKLAKDSTLKARLAKHDAEMRARNGQPIADNKLFRLTNVSSSRGPVVVENLFGEGLQLHQRDLLKDYSVDRHAVVHYDHWWQYGVELLVVLLFLSGVVCGLRTRLMQLLLAWWACDMALHVGLGFGLIEVYIMSAHWMFIIPIAIGVLMQRLQPHYRRPLRVVVALLAVYLMAYNGSLLVGYLLQ